jgi:hypothetical protein
VPPLPCAHELRRISVSKTLHVKSAFIQPIMTALLCQQKRRPSPDVHGALFIVSDRLSLTARDALLPIASASFKVVLGALIGALSVLGVGAR